MSLKTLSYFQLEITQTAHLYSTQFYQVIGDKNVRIEYVIFYPRHYPQYNNICLSYISIYFWMEIFTLYQLQKEISNPFVSYIYKIFQPVSLIYFRMYCFQNCLYFRLAFVLKNCFDIKINFAMVIFLLSNFQQNKLRIFKFLLLFNQKY